MKLLIMQFFLTSYHFNGIMIINGGKSKKLDEKDLFSFLFVHHESHAEGIAA
jgi:hypothetical protein